MRAVLSLIIGLFGASHAHGEIELLGVAILPGNQADRSGLVDVLSDRTPHNRLGGHGSAIAYSGRGQEYLMAADRGPKDGATNFACRIHRFEIRVTPGREPVVQARLQDTVLLRNEAGQRFIGSQNAIDLIHPERSLRLDPEGIRVGLQGTIFIADEYGPNLYEFSKDGRRIRSHPIPPRFRPRNPAVLPKDELPPLNSHGRQPNRGMEGLAISPDGRRLFGLMQSPLLQDGALDAKNLRIGVNNRLLQIDAATGKTREFVYQLESPANGCSEILAINDHLFLVLERDGKGGLEAGFKKIFRIDLANATDASGIDRLPAVTLPASIRPVTKRLVADLLEPRFQIAGSDCPEKFEGLAFGPNLPDGRKLLLVTVDNDFVKESPIRIYAFAYRP